MLVALGGRRYPPGRACTGSRSPFLRPTDRPGRPWSSHPLFAILRSWFAFAHFFGIILSPRSPFAAKWSPCAATGRREKEKERDPESSSKEWKYFSSPFPPPPSLYPPFDIPCPTATGAAEQAGWVLSLCKLSSINHQCPLSSPPLFSLSFFLFLFAHQTLTAQSEFLLAFAFAPSLPNFGSPAARDATRRR